MSAPVRGCYGKKQYVGFINAALVAKHINRKDDHAHVAAYHCRHCNHFHVGENPMHGRKRLEEVEEGS